MTGINILGTGSYVPNNIVKNNDFTKFIDTSDEWITTRTGIKERRITTTEHTWQLGAFAAQDALNNAGVNAEEIDLILFSTVTADFYTPSMACVVQREIKATNAMCIDVNCACSGFVYAIDMARRYLATGDVNKALVISAEELSKITDYTDRSTCVLFGDGAGAIVLEKAEDSLYSSYLKADATNADVLFARGISSKTPFYDGEKDPDGFRESNGHYLYMNGKEVYKFAINALPEAVLNACEKAGITVDDIDYIVPHQANVRIVETAANKLNFPMDKMYMNLEKYGNTSSASISICLDEMNKNGLLKKGQIICTVGFGAGLTYGATIFKW